MCVVRLWEPMQSPSNVSVAISTAPAGHVTVLMLKNALVNINRPGWQDKFAFMPEEEKTSISLTQKRQPLLQWRPPSQSPKESVLIVCISCLTESNVPGVLASSKHFHIQPTGWLAATYGSLLRPWVVCEIPRPVGNCPSQANRPAVQPMEKVAVGILIVKASHQWFYMYVAYYLHIVCLTFLLTKKDAMIKNVCPTCH